MLEPAVVEAEVARVQRDVNSLRDAVRRYRAKSHDMQLHKL
jgi:hypothetical protein